MATGAELIDDVLQSLDDIAAVFWTRAEILTHLNDGLKQLNLMSCKFQSERAFAPTTQSFQVTPTGAIAVLHVSKAGVFLRKDTLEGMDRDPKKRGKWQNETTALAAGFKQWGPIGSTLFFLYPKLSGTGPVVTLVTLDEPTAIADSGTTIALDPEYCEALEDYAVHMARFKEGGAEFEQSMADYDAFIERCGGVEQRSMSEQYALWGSEPKSDTGLGYSTKLRS